MPAVGSAGSGESGDKAGFAEDSRADSAGALLAERFAAVLAKCNSFTIRMVGAVHTNSPSCRYFKTLGVKTTKAWVAGMESGRCNESANCTLPLGVSRRLEPGPGLGRDCFWIWFLDLPACWSSAVAGSPRLLVWLGSWCCSRPGLARVRSRRCRWSVADRGRGTRVRRRPEVVVVADEHARSPRRSCA